MQHFGHAQDGAQRGAQLMADACDQPRLKIAGFSSFCSQGLNLDHFLRQLFLIPAGAPQRLVQVADGQGKQADYTDHGHRKIHP